MKELFLKSHASLLKAFDWIHSPIFYCEKGTFSDADLQNIGNGSIVQGNNKVGDGIELIHAIPKESLHLIIKTFCESHTRLKEMI